MVAPLGYGVIIDNGVMLEIMESIYEVDTCLSGEDACVIGLVNGI